MNKSKTSKSTKIQDFEAKQNLLGFFNLLLQIDKRNNPHLYQKSYENKRDTNNSN